MATGFWQKVVASDHQVPAGCRLPDLTEELTTMLGSTDPEVRDDIAYPTLATWISRGVYDDLLAGLGDGMTAGLRVGLGERGTDTVFRRSFSALVLAECIERDTDHGLVPGAKVLDWGDRLMGWFLREQDTRGFTSDHGWAHALAHGADGLGALARSPHLGLTELTVVLDVLADRVLAPGPLLTAGEHDRFALAAMSVLLRNLVPLDVLERWVTRVRHGATAPVPPDVDPGTVTGNPEAFLRALHLQLALGARRPGVRSDLLLVVIDAVTAANAPFLRTGQ
jgi:hypothetical protein